LQTAGKTLLGGLPATNRDESKMTVLMMTGTTALVRAIAYKMEIKGLDYPILKVKDWFKNADLIHVSDEVSFNPDCPFPDYNGGLQMCSSPRYIQTLQDLGVNVVELTGNHENDYGSQYLESTIDTYKKLGWATFGGGKTPAEAQAPATVEANGNKIAFIGCNPDGPTSDWATDKQAGSAKCDMDYFAQQIKDLKAQGYVVVATFQQAEIYNSYIYGDQLAGVFRTAANSGADIVSGSEAHYAMGFQFIGNNLIHFGLGNFMFDQMAYEGVPGDNIRREFIDRHIIYNGKYISTQLLTAQLVDWAQPNPMTEQQRVDFLTDVFNGSLWSKKQ
jgi:poly-gamma-glutamate synthesis protein (capsule biosynthesis protein)